MTNLTSRILRWLRLEKEPTDTETKSPPTGSIRQRREGS